MPSVSHRRRFLVGLTSLLAGAAGNGFAADASAPLKLIVPTPPGSAADALARALSVSLGRQSGRGVVVENIAGAGSLVGTQQLARAPKDGLVLGVVSSNHTIIPGIFKNAPFDAIADFEPITMIGSLPMMLVASRNVEASTAAELVKLAKSRSTTLAEGLVTGSVYQIASEVFKEQAGIATNRIFYKGSAQITNDLLAGILDIAFVSAQGAAPHIAAGKLKAIAVNTPTRTEIAPQVPTLAESGFPKFDVDAWLAIVSPAGIPADSAAARRREIEAALAQPEMKKALQMQGIQLRRMTPAQMVDFMKAEVVRNEQVIQRVGVKVD
jgi:tripartite-type tricarboxylate transporter receptor subunit TctC